MRRLALVVLFLPGCVETGPSPEILALQEQCQAGNTQACTVLVQNRQAAQSTWAYNPGYQNPQDYMTGATFPQQTRQQTTCYAYGNLINCY